MADYLWSEWERKKKRNRQAVRETGREENSPRSGQRRVRVAQSPTDSILEWTGFMGMAGPAILAAGVTDAEEQLASRMQVRVIKKSGSTQKVLLSERQWNQGNWQQGRIC